FISVLAPLFFGVIASLFVHEIRFLPFDNAPAETNQRRDEQYFKVFPLQHKGVISHGAVAYAAWLAAGGTTAFLLLQWYYTLIARRVKSSNWWTALYAGAPIFLLPIFFVVTMRESVRMHFDVFEDSFLFFSGHPLAIVVALAGLAGMSQIWCERRFSQLELL
ncbi:MAG TPA: hypothetical protein VFC44_18475, partial [Candidatus Saccharimonadales bacterium]|nr:hypothetical protein [Candidatus Saccharimonadales bacterium]